eukprot:10966067-Lingulodinium_polyedra.AAC.1
MGARWLPPSKATRHQPNKINPGASGSCESALPDRSRHPPSQGLGPPNPNDAQRRAAKERARHGKPEQYNAW